MRILRHIGAQHPDQAPFDAAERKGIGHPDSLADLVADSFSRRYASSCLREYGVVPNHWVDKMNLVGAAANVYFGGFDISKPIGCYLFGKVTRDVGDRTIPIEAMFEDVVREALPAALGDRSVLDHLRLIIDNSAGVAVDHDPQFYAPRTAHELGRVLDEETLANDTVLCAGSSVRGTAAEIAVWLELMLTAPSFRRRFPTGTDVKVMAVRHGSEIDVTAAVPFHPTATPAWDDYRQALDEIQVEVAGELKRLIDMRLRVPVTALRLRLNTKDIPGRGYLAPFGTSLGKGDCGAVGRGNRYNGVIDPLRPASGEAPAGKNPLHHVGKIYTAIAHEAAAAVMERCGTYAEVVIAARNGDRIDRPAFVHLRTQEPVGPAAEAAVAEVVMAAPRFCDSFLATDPIERFREELR